MFLFFGWFWSGLLLFCILAAGFPLLCASMIPIFMYFLYVISQFIRVSFTIVSLFWPILIWPFVLLHFINWASFTLCFRGMDLMSFMQFQNSYVFVSQSPFSLLCCFWSGFVLSFHYMNWVPSALCFHDLGSHVLFHIRILVLWTGFRFVNYIEEKREMLCVYDVDVIILSFFLFVNLGNKEQ